MAMRKVKKQQVYISKITTLHVQHTFFTFLCHHRMTTEWKSLISRFMEDVNKRQQIFQTCMWSPRNQLHVNLPTFDIFRELEWVRQSLNKCEFILKVTFSLPLIPKLPNCFIGNQRWDCKMSGCILRLKSKGTCLIFTEEMDFKEQKQTPKPMTFKMHHVPSSLFHNGNREDESSLQYLIMHPDKTSQPFQPCQPCLPCLGDDKETEELPDELCCMKCDINMNVYCT